MFKKAKITVWDVDHGLAVWLNTPNGRDVVIDLGAGSHCGDVSFSPLQYMKRNGVATIEHLIITHPHADHIDDILNLDIPVRVFARPRGLDRSALETGLDEDRRKRLDSYYQLDGTFNDEVPADLRSELAGNWGGVTFLPIVPPVDICEKNINNYSIVTVIQFAGIKVIVPGDNEPSSWKALSGLAYFSTLMKDADILVAPHHGRESGFDEGTIKMINPRLTIISDKSSENTASDKYRKVSRGWAVFKSNGSRKERKCLTTRKDGRVQVEFWYDDNERRPYLNVSIL